MLECIDFVELLVQHFDDTVLPIEVIQPLSMRYILDSLYVYPFENYLNSCMFHNLVYTVILYQIVCAEHNGVQQY